MKILLAGDTHGNTSHIITLLDNAVKEGCDRVFVLGDFGAWEHVPSGVKFFNDVDRHAKVRDVTVYWLDGNHDKTSLVLDKYGSELDEESFMVCRPNLRYSFRGHTWEWGGQLFASFGGAYSVDKDYRLWVEEKRNKPEEMWFPEEEMTDEYLDSMLKTFDGGVNILLTHDKPRASNPRWNRKDLKECWPNQDRIQRAVEELKPHSLYHGHLHYRYEDTIDNGGGETQVTGLDADPSAGERKFYRVENSWEVLDLGK